MAIRKVVGASVMQIAARLNREFFWLLLAANLLAWPLAYLRRRQLAAGVRQPRFHQPAAFAVAALSALLLAMLTVSLQTLRAARANPVDSLRSE